MRKRTSLFVSFVAVILALGIMPPHASAQDDSSASTDRSNYRKIPFMGYYYTQLGPNYDYRAEAAATSNLEVVPEGAIPWWDKQGPAKYRAHGMRLIVGLHLSREEMINAHGEIDVHLNRLRYWLNHYGYMDLVIGFTPNEEIFNGLHAGSYDHWPEFRGLNCYQKANVMRLGLERGYAKVKEYFPKKYLIASGGGWNDLPEYGCQAYAPPPRNADALQIFAYIPASYWRPSCDAGMKDTFNRIVAASHRHALKRFNKPIVIVGQAFTDTDPRSIWRNQLLPCQLDWFYELAQEDYRYHALVWFSYMSVPNLQTGELVNTGVRDMVDNRIRIAQIWGFNQSR